MVLPAWGLNSRVRLATACCAIVLAICLVHAAFNDICAGSEEGPLVGISGGIVLAPLDLQHCDKMTISTRR